jgi:hypothetical protein
MSCPTEEEMIQLLDGELSQNSARVLEQHLGGCPGCHALRGELERMVGRLAPAPDEFDEPALRQAILTRLSREATASPAQPWWQRLLRPVVLVPVLAAAGALLLAIQVIPRGALPERQPGEFAVRGGGEKEARRWINLWIFSHGEGGYRPVQRQIEADAALAFGYLNVRGAHRHLMVFGLDAGGEVRWYYPAYEQRGTDPQSIAIRPGRHQLPDEVKHPLPAGPLMIYALFSATPLRVSRIEKMVAHWRDGGAAAAPERWPLEGIAQLSRALHVRAED